MGELDGLAAIVTGAAKNIGRAIALGLADGGAAVAIVTRTNIAGAKSVAAEIGRTGGRALAIKADITNADDVKRMVDETASAFGGIAILVNNAGIRPESPLEDMTMAEWRSVFAVTLEGAFLCCQAALPHLAKSGKGAIVNIGGLTAYTGAARRTHVVAAKAGLDGLTKALAIELAPRGITVNLVAPGLIETERDANSVPSPDHHKTHKTLTGRRGAPEDVAAMVRHLAGPAGRYLTGQTIHVNGGAYLP